LIPEKFAAMAVGFLYGAAVHTVVDIDLGKSVILHATKNFRMVPEEAAFRNFKTHQNTVPDGQANDEQRSPKKFIAVQNQRSFRAREVRKPIHEVQVVPQAREPGNGPGTTRNTQVNGTKTNFVDTTKEVEETVIIQHIVNLVKDVVEGDGLPTDIFKLEHK